MLLIQARNQAVYFLHLPALVPKEMPYLRQKNYDEAFHLLRTPNAKCNLEKLEKQNGTLCCGLGLCLEFASFVFVAFASVFPFPVHGRLELCVHVAPRIRCGAATSQNEKMDF